MPAKTPQEAALVEHGREWAVGPEGRAIFGWGVDGDFKRCEDFYKAKTPMPARMIPGWCAKLHKLATGATPGHAPAELAGKAAKAGH